MQEIKSQKPQDLSELILTFPATPKIATSLFHGSMKSAMEQIANALGTDDAIIRYYDKYPPQPLNRESWNKQYGCYEEPERLEDYGMVRIRPDLILYPVFLVAILTHEGVHALDPAVAQESLATLEFAKYQSGASASFSQLLHCAHLHYGNDIRANEKTIEVMQKISAPQGLLLEQLIYFTEQQEAVIAARLRVVTVDKTRLLLVNLAQDLVELIPNLTAPNFNPQEKEQLLKVLGSIFDHSQSSPILTSKWSTSLNKSLEELSVAFKPLVGSAQIPDAQRLIERSHQRLTEAQNWIPNAIGILEKNERAKSKLHLPPLKVI